MREHRVTVAVVMACFNRRATTLRCLDRLVQQQTDRLKINVYLLDDASSDGTGAAVHERFPEVHVLEGNGQCFWGGGMHCAMRAALAAEFDFMLWLNDDVVLDERSIKHAIDSYRAIERDTGFPKHVVVGATRAQCTGDITYSGFRQSIRWHPSKLVQVIPDPHRNISLDSMNGNFVLLPRQIVEFVGLIDPVFVQQLGDIDYGYRIRKAGGTLWLAPGTIGTCEANNKPRRWQNPELTVAERIQLLNTPHGLPFRPWLTFMWRYAGPLGITLLAFSYIKALSASVTQRGHQPSGDLSLGSALETPDE